MAAATGTERFTLFSFHFQTAAVRSDALRALGALGFDASDTIGNGVFLERSKASLPYSTRVWWNRLGRGKSCKVEMPAFEFMCCHRVHPTSHDFLRSRVRLENCRYAVYVVPVAVGGQGATPGSPADCSEVRAHATAYVHSVRSPMTLVGVASSPLLAGSSLSACGHAAHRSTWLVSVALKKWDSLVQRGERYSLAAVIGEGTFGVVYQAKFDGLACENLVVKKLKRDASSHEVVLKELCFLERCKGASAHIVQLMDVFVANQTVHLVFESWGTSLLAFMRQRLAMQLDVFDRFEIFAVIRDVCEGLAFLHSLHVVHGDVKPENVLVRQCVVGRSSSLVEHRRGALHCKMGDLGTCLEVWLFKLQSFATLRQPSMPPACCVGSC